MKVPFHLVQERLSKDTLEALKELYDDAKEGKLIGIAFAAMYQGRHYIVDAAGEADRSPTFAIGMVEMLAHTLKQKESGGGLK